MCNVYENKQYNVKDYFKVVGTSVHMCLEKIPLISWINEGLFTATYRESSFGLFCSESLRGMEPFSGLRVECGTKEDRMALVAI